jgi:hypothetical protein
MSAEGKINLNSGDKLNLNTEMIKEEDENATNAAVNGMTSSSHSGQLAYSDFQLLDKHDFGKLVLGVKLSILSSWNFDKCTIWESNDFGKKYRFLGKTDFEKNKILGNTEFGKNKILGKIANLG